MIFVWLVNRSIVSVDCLVTIVTACARNIAAVTLVLHVCFSYSDQSARRSFILSFFILINRSGIFERYNVVSVRQM